MLKEKKIHQDWTFKNQNTREHAHQFHDYPARMIPQIADKLIEQFGRKDGLLFDPYCGSGTTLLEGLYHDMNAIGFDLNPLARLIAKVKTTKVNINILESEIKKLIKAMDSDQSGQSVPNDFHIDGLLDVFFWFKKDVISKLLLIRNHIDKIKDQDVADFLRVAFSETVRESSNTRMDEFKLYRYAPEKLEKHNPDVYSIMKGKISRNISAYEDLELRLIEKKWRTVQICNTNSCDKIPSSLVEVGSVDLIVTSPPYGDSKTTVAYGQYSRLSSAWLGFKSHGQVDSNLMGGKKKRREPLPSKIFTKKLAEIERLDKKRADEVFAFYKDLHDSIRNIARTLKIGGHVCYVVGNRTVKGITLPTDLIVQDFFEAFQLRYVDTYTREIPNKRMPLKNSPTNEVGAKVATMLNEYIVILKKKPTKS